MRKFIFIVVATIIVGIVVVSIPKSKKGEPVSQEVEKEDTIDSIAVAASKEASERLAYWFPHHDSLNHGLVLVAEELWKLDSAAANSNTIGRFVWHDKCEKALSHCFDSIHPSSNLSKMQKADSMLTEIATFFEQDADYSTMGMIVNIDLQNDFLIYVYESAIIDYSHLGFSHDADCSISLFDNLAKK